MKNLNCKSKVFISTLMTLFTVSVIVIAIVCTSCCIDLNKFLKPESTKITFDGGDDIGGDEIDELLDKYNIDPEDFTSSSDNQNAEDIDYTVIKKELADTSSYQVSAEEEVEFLNNLEEIYDGETFILVKDFLRDFKILYPSGYFTLIKVTQKQSHAGGYGWFELLNKSKSFAMGDFNSRYCRDINVIVHELTHGGSGLFIYLFVQDLKDYPFGQYYSYMVGNLLIFIEKDKMFFSKYELFPEIENPDSFDKTYLDPDRIIDTVEGEDVKGSDIDFTMILDELNAYTVSEKCAIATEEFVSQGNSSTERYGLLKQMSYLELYLKRCNEKYPEDWKYITGHRELAFLIMKLWQEAEKFETAVKDDSRFNLNSESVSEFVHDPENYEIIEMFFEESGILEYKNKNFIDIDAEFDKLSVYDINNL